MKVRQAIELARGLKQIDQVNYPDILMLQFLNECEGKLQTEFLHIADVDCQRYTEDDMEMDLIVGPPHDKLYYAYLCAMIDFTNGEYAKYNNSIIVANAFMAEWAAWFNRTHERDGRQYLGVFLSAYGIAVKHGYAGTEEEWLESLRGPEGQQGIQGKPGPQGAPGTVSFDELTPEQVAMLKGDKGDKGDKGETGPKGADGADGAQGPAGPQGPVGPAGPQGEKGETGSGFKVLDYYDTLEAMESAVPNPNVGDAYGVGTADPYDIYIYGKTSGWVNNGPLQGAKGDTGEQGPVGPAGPQGETGPAGPQGPEGPRGETGLQGETGPAGSDGQDGVSPLVSVSEITGGHRVSIQDADGTSSFDVMDGKDGADGQDGKDGQSGAAGADGITPTIGANGNWYVGQTDTGVAATGPQGIQGETGPTGAAGYTPVRGTDYWTAEDQQAIVDDVLAALPAWEGGSY